MLSSRFITRSRELWGNMSGLQRSQNSLIPQPLLLRTVLDLRTPSGLLPAVREGEQEIQSPSLRWKRDLG